MADVITRLKVESNEYDSKIKRAAQGLQHMEDACRKVGGTLARLEKDQLEFVQGLGKMETVSKTARGRLGELTSAFTDLRAQYNRLTQEEKNGDFGRALNQSLGQLKVRINDAKKELSDINKELDGGTSKFGKFGSLVDGLGQKMGLSVNLTEMLTSKASLMAAGIGAVTTAVAAATKAWAEYNSELAKQQQITTVTTGLKGDDADQMTAAARAISKVYGTDFREVINAANILMAQFGKTGDEAIQLIRDGMQGMIMGDGGKLLSMIQQYAPAFRDAGIEASQLIAIIQNSEGGIFSAENMNAIVMGIKNIRLMTNATSEALSKIGIDGQKMSEQLRNGTLTIFDALGKVAKAIENTNSSSQEAGQVMQQVFGRQGAMAGTKLGEAIATLNTNLDETKRQTGEVGEGYDELTGAVYRFETALQKTFGFKGWEEMESFIKTDFYNTLSDVIEVAGRLYQTFWSTNDILDEIGKNTAFENMLAGIIAITQPLVTVASLIKQIRDGFNQAHAPNDWMGGAQTGGISVKPEGTYTETRVNGVLTNATRDGKDVTSEILEYYRNLYKPKNTPKGGRGSSGGSKTVLSEEQQNVKTIKELSEAYEKASEERRKAIEEEIKKLQERNAEIKYYKDLALGNKVRPMGADVMEGQGIGLNTIGNIQKEVQDALKQPIDVSSFITPLERMEEELKKLIELRDQALTSGEYQSRNRLVEAKQAEIDQYQGKRTGKGDDSMSRLSKSVSGLQSVTNGLEKIGLQIPSEVQSFIGVIEGIMSVIQGVQTIIAATQTPAIIANTIALGTLSTQMAVNNAMKILPFFANGGVVHATNGWSGVVPGNSFSGDNVPALLNSQEVVLNAAQTSQLAQNLQGKDAGLHIVGKISGNDLLLCIDRTGMVTGKGELVFFRNS